MTKVNLIEARKPTKADPSRTCYVLRWWTDANKYRAVTVGEVGTMTKRPSCAPPPSPMKRSIIPVPFIQPPPTRTSVPLCGPYSLACWAWMDAGSPIASAMIVGARRIV